MDKKIKMALMALMALTLVTLTSGYTVFAADYSDMSNHWSKSQVSRWSDYGVIRGSNNQFRPNDYITRGEMAVIMDKVMGYQTKAINSFSDLDQSFYTDSILKANYAGVINGAYGLVRPKDNITREEASVLMCKAFNISESLENNLKFADSTNVSLWAKEYVNALSNKGYITGRGGIINNFDPRGNITRAEAVTIVDNIVKGFYSQTGTYSENINGNIVVNTPNVILKNMNITGDLIVAEGVSTGDFTVDGVKISGSVILKGGGINSIHFKGNTIAPKVELAKTDGDIRISVEESANIDSLNIPEGAKNVLLTGKINNVQSKSSNKVSLISANISNFSGTGKNFNIDLDKNSIVKTLFLSETAIDSKLNLLGEVSQLNISSPQSIITSAQGSKIDTLNSSSSALNSKINIGGELKTASIGSSGTSFKAEQYSNVSNIDMLNNVSNLSVEITSKTDKVNMLSENSSLTSGNDSVIESINIDAKEPNLYINGNIVNVDLKAPDTNISVRGKIKKINALNTATNAKIYAEKDCKIDTINIDAKNTEVSGKGNVSYVYVNGNNSKINTTNTKITVASGINGTTSNNKNIYAGTSGSISSNGDIITDNGYDDDMYSQVAPTGLTTVPPTSWKNDDGKIVGTTKKMQYRQVDESTYKDCDEGETTGLSSGKYYVRYKEKDSYYAGKTSTVTIESYEISQNSTDANIAIADKKINVVRNIDNLNRTIDVVENATASQLLNGIKAYDNSVQTYTLYKSDSETKITYMYDTNLNNIKLRVVSHNGNVSRIYTVRQVVKSANIDLSIINGNKITTIDNTNFKIKATSDATKSQIENSIKATDNSQQTYTFYKSATSNDIYIDTKTIDGVRLRVTSENGKKYRDYIINEPMTVSIGTQTGSLTASTVGEVKFNIITKNIADGKEVKIAETDSFGNIKTTTSGLTLTSTKIYNNLATITAKTSTALKDGNYYFKITVDGITSSVATIKVDTAKPIIIKSILIGKQIGNLESGKASNTKFDLSTKNIADNQIVTIFETDSKGNKKTSTKGLTFSSNNTKSNLSTVTVYIDKNVKDGSYYFKTSVDGTISSNIAEIKVNPTIVKEINVSSQKGELVSGKAGSITFDVTTKNISDNETVKVEQINGKDLGITFESTNTKSNLSTITAKINNKVKAGSYYFKVTIDGVVSSITEFKINEPEIIKTISVESQSGKLVSGTEQSTSFKVNTKNIADGEDVIIFETDINGNIKNTSGLTITSTKIASNEATVTAKINNTVQAGNYYFKITTDNIISNIVTIKVEQSVPVSIPILDSVIDNENTISVSISNISEKVISKNDFSIKIKGINITNFEVLNQNDTTCKIIFSDSLSAGQEIVISGQNNLSGSTKKVYIVDVSLSISDISDKGFELNLTPAVNGLITSDIILSPSALITSVISLDGGKTYTIVANLTASPYSYSITTNKPGYNFKNVPAIFSVSEIRKNVSNPFVIVELKNDVFTDEALKTENWMFDSKTSGLAKINSIVKNSSTQVAINFDGALGESGEFAISALKNSLKKNIDTNIFVFKISEEGL